MDNIITVVGLGRVGLPTALCLANVGFTVYGFDKDKAKIEALESGKVLFYEPGLEQILTTTLDRTFFPTSEPSSIAKSDCSIISVNVPFSRHGLVRQNLNAALHQVGTLMRKGHLVIVKSTLQPGMTDRHVKVVLERLSGFRCGSDFSLAVVPERLIEGQAIRLIKELPNVIGAVDDVAYQRANAIFEKLGKPSMRVSPEGAEIAKLLENYWRDVTFAVANEAAMICNRLGVDALEAIDAANYQNPYASIPKPSPGVGGACLPKDPLMLADSSAKHGFSPKLLLEARRTNQNVTNHVFNSVKRLFRKTRKPLKTAKVLLLGLAYKKGTDDVRNSPAEKLIQLFKAKGASVLAYDPFVADRDFSTLGVTKVELLSGLGDADCVVVVTNHEEFMELNPSLYVKNDCIIADFWGLWDGLNLSRGTYCGWRTRV